MGVVTSLIKSVKDDRAVESVTIGTYDCMVVSRSTGLSSTFRDPCGPGARSGKAPQGVKNAGELLGMSALELAVYAKSGRLLEASVGIAALNSLLVPESAALVEANAFEIIAERGRDKKVAIIGHFPFVKRLRDMVDLTVIQKEPWKKEEALGEAEKYLPGCDVVAITASSLINRTFDRLLELSSGAFVIVLGPSTPLSPVMFEAGVNVLCGAVVEDKELTLRCITQGATFREVRGVKRVAMRKTF